MVVALLPASRAHGSVVAGVDKIFLIRGFYRLAPKRSFMLVLESFKIVDAVRMY